MAPSLGIVESAWLFRRGAQSVRIVRVGHRDSRLTLLVLGPDGSRISHQFDDALSCAMQQCEIERQLASRDFCLTGVGFANTAVPGSPCPVLGSNSQC